MGSRDLTKAMLVEEGLELLDEAECRALIGRAGVGRVAVTIEALPAIFPVNFVVSDDAVVFRTSPGTKLAAATAHAVVAFECDEMQSFERSGWSVLVVGMARAVTDPDVAERLSRLPLAPWVEGRRDNFVQIGIEFISGRRIVHGQRGVEEP